MKAHRIIIAAVAVCFISCYNALAGSTKEWDTENWMKGLPDETYLCSMSIPGTHDSCTKGVSSAIAGWAQTQTLSLEDQFKKGIRAFDLRPAIEIEFLSTRLGIFHGIFSCDLAFDDAVSSLKSLVANHPSEFIIMIVNVEDNKVFSTSKTKEEVASREKSYIGNERFVQEFRPDLTLGEVRGKILIFNRDDYSAYSKSLPAAFFNGWGSGPTSGTITNGARKGSGGTNSTRFYVQDVDHYASDKNWKESKFNYFEETADNYYADKDFFVWCFNCASAWVGHNAAAMDYNENSDKVNGHLANEYLPKTERYHVRGAWRGVGIVLMDYGGITKYGSHNVYGSDLIDALIDVNYDCLDI